MFRPWLLLKCVASGLLLWLVLARIHVDALLLRLGAARPAFIALALAVLVLQVAAAALRWHIVASAPARTTSYAAFFRFLLIGQFFNQMLPSTIGGDGMRAWLHHRAGASLKDAVNGTLVDRLAGLLALLGLVILATPVQATMIPDPAVRLALELTSGAGILAFVTLLGLGGRVGDRLPRLGPIRALHELALRVRGIMARPRIAAAVLALSLLVHAASVVGIWSLAQALALAIDLVDLSVLVPPMLLLSMIPISVAGWGLREGLMVMALRSRGVPAEDALLLSALFGLALLSVSLPGGLLWLLHRAGPKRAQMPARAPLAAV